MFYCIEVAATASQKRGLKVWPETQNGFPWMIAVISGQTSFSMVAHNNGQGNYHFFSSIWDASVPPDGPLSPPLMIDAIFLFKEIVPEII